MCVLSIKNIIGNKTSVSLSDKYFFMPILYALPVSMSLIILDFNNNWFCFPNFESLINKFSSFINDSSISKVYKLLLKSCKTMSIDNFDPGKYIFLVKGSISFIFVLFLIILMVCSRELNILFDDKECIKISL